ncbi:l1 transposable element-related [Holotrichia oblita]|uniref:L1 transposable element-related n=1 Tax=Holotrichia oblita TaxID=644536 RepID=A0ACB9SGQ0_HOLOL|nr:l1 transposable element-related [Holotrichia oblita]
MMAGDNYDRSTRSKAEQEELINRVIEKVLTNKTFLEKMLNAVHDALSSRDQKIKELEDRIELQEQYSRSNNLRIFGVPESQAEKVEDVIVKICSDKLNLNISTADIDCCHRLKGKRRNSSSNYSPFLPKKHT